MKKRNLKSYKGMDLTQYLNKIIQLYILLYTKVLINSLLKSVKKLQNGVEYKKITLFHVINPVS